MTTVLSRSAVFAFVIGLVIGLLLGLISVVLAPVALVLIPLALAVSATGLREVPRENRRSAGGAGVLIGAGAVLMFGALNTFTACAGTDDFCGNANIAPLFALALFTLVCGVLVSILTVVVARQRGTSADTG
jgi:hypothetical protein